ncbi:YgjV family protein [Marinomonas sp. RSW2]|uniref:YgjV family protein n=1 Tax=Marinomonas maritima TaxID=2940935 RepID=A0ABT5WGS4_9GAMM|nr:YgjV family protein [Marinomonas maritima]MDE8603614.1 YgjV family protein [Marinomonas maritima]
MSAFLISQILIAIAILFDLISFQFKERKKIVGCLCIAGTLISVHFILLQQYTSSGLMALAVIRYFLSMFTTSKSVMSIFIIFSLFFTAFTYTGLASLISCIGAVMQTIAAFCQHDKKLRKLMIIGTSFWLLNNYLVGSPAAVAMEILFIASNLIGYYRFHIKPDLKSH